MQAKRVHGKLRQNHTSKQQVESDPVEVASLRTKRGMYCTFTKKAHKWNGRRKIGQNKMFSKLLPLGRNSSGI